MIDVEYLHQRLEHYKVIGTVESESDLVALPAGNKIESLEKFQSAPNRIERTVRLASSESFSEYVNRFKEEETTVYLDIDRGIFNSVIDHHGADKPAWSDHGCVFQPKLSLEWKAWTGIHRQKLSQTQLAEFIEDNLDAIHEPEPNEMLAHALKFQSVERMTYASSMNLNDGSSQFTFNKDNATATVEFPHRIKLYMPLHENESAHFYELRVRYRTDSEGALVFVVSFVKDPDHHVRDALNLECD